MDQDLEGSCYCGAARVTVSGQPAVAAYCHCQSCRKWHAAPIIAWAAWPADKVTITGETVISKHHAESARISCAKCGGNIANRRPMSGVMVIYAMALVGSGFEFEPCFHIFYDERVMDVSDGLPKYADAPEALGYSGKLVDEPANTGWRSGV